MTRSRATAKQAGTAVWESNVAERLWSRTAIGSPDQCWEWQGYRRPGGHGQIGLGRTLHGTHRVAWMVANTAEIPTGMFVRHRCDNPPCVNPRHLELGTAAQNSRDAVDRGRTARGDRLPHTRLSDAQVREIRERYQRFVVPGRRGAHTNRAALASEYGVAPSYITAIAYRRERADVS